MADLQSVVINKLLDGSWKALHVPSQRVTHGLTKDEAEGAMRALLGVDESGRETPPPTSPQFSGLAQEIAVCLEGPVSQMLGLHDGYARLERFDDGIAYVLLGGGCKGCPSSLITLTGGVKAELQHRFGADQVVDVLPVMAEHS